MISTIFFSANTFLISRIHHMHKITVITAKVSICDMAMEAMAKANKIQFLFSFSPYKIFQKDETTNGKNKNANDSPMALLIHKFNKPQEEKV